MVFCLLSSIKKKSDHGELTAVRRGEQEMKARVCRGVAT